MTSPTVTSSPVFPGGGPSTGASDALYFYSGTAGLVLVFAVLEHGYDIAYRDELTGLPGRRAFNDVMAQLGGTYAIAMCDVDHFKKFNDTYGHDTGDQVLRMVAAQLSQVGGGGQVQSLLQVVPPAQATAPGGSHSSPRSRLPLPQRNSQEHWPGSPAAMQP